MPGEKYLAKQCRDRWRYVVNPDINTSEWTIEEDMEMFKLYLEHGSRWATIATLLKSRNDIQVKNRFHYFTKRNIIPLDPSQTDLALATLSPVHASSIYKNRRTIKYE